MSSGVGAPRGGAGEGQSCPPPPPPHNLQTQCSHDGFGKGSCGCEKSLGYDGLGRIYAVALDIQYTFLSLFPYCLHFFLFLLSLHVYLYVTAYVFPYFLVFRCFCIYSLCYFFIQCLLNLLISLSFRCSFSNSLYISSFRPSFFLRLFLFCRILSFFRYIFFRSFCLCFFVISVCVFLSLSSFDSQAVLTLPRLLSLQYFRGLMV